jgi:hypothetical protein
MLSFIGRIDKTWKAVMVIIGIIVSTIGGWNYTMAQAKETAQTAVDAKVNSAMIEGAKKAAADAVKEQLPEIAKQVAKEVAAEVVKQQAAEVAKKKQK